MLEKRRTEQYMPNRKADMCHICIANCKCRNTNVLLLERYLSKVLEW